MGAYIKRSDVMAVCEKHYLHYFDSNDSAGMQTVENIEKDVCEIPADSEVMHLLRQKTKGESWRFHLL